MRGEELKWRQLAHHQLMTSHGPHLVHTVQLKTMIEPHFSGRIVSSGISYVLFTSVYSEKTHLKKLMKMIIISMNKSQESKVFSRRQKLTSDLKLRPDSDG